MLYQKLEEHYTEMVTAIEALNQISSELDSYLSDNMDYTNRSQDHAQMLVDQAKLLER